MDLKDLRNEIDEIDDELVKLFTKRMDVATRIADVKKEKSLPIFVPAREREKLLDVSEKAGPEMANYTRVLYSMLFELSRSHQNKLNGNISPLYQQITEAIENTPKLFPQAPMVACQGVEGAYSQIACEKIFKSPFIMYFRNFEGVFSAIDKGLCQYGILPLENSTAGSVTQVYDLMEQHAFHIVGACRLRIDHCLLRKKGAKGPITRVVSHEQALRQCSDYLEAHPLYQAEAMKNTAVAAEYVANCEANDVAVIASAVCADIYGLEIAEENISNVQNNFTRFICISRELKVYPNARKVSIMFNLPHAPGALNNIISRLALAGVNLTKLESRPIPGREFEFRFFFDFEADLHDPAIVDLISELEKRTEHFVFLGAYSE